MKVVQPHENHSKLSYFFFPAELERFGTVEVDATVVEISHFCQILLSSSSASLAKSQSFRLFPSCISPFLTAREMGEAAVDFWHNGGEQRKIKQQQRGPKMWRPGSSPESLCFLSMIAVLLPRTLCVCVGMNSSCMKQDLTDSGMWRQRRQCFWTLVPTANVATFNMLKCIDVMYLKI